MACIAAIGIVGSGLSVVALGTPLQFVWAFVTLFVLCAYMAMLASKRSHHRNGMAE